MIAKTRGNFVFLVVLFAVTIHLGMWVSRVLDKHTRPSENQGDGTTNLNVANTATNGVGEITFVGSIITAADLPNGNVLIAEQPQVHTNMPPGWTLETNGEEWRFVSRNGPDMFLSTTREKAIRDAWSFWRHCNRVEGTWVTVE